MILTRDKLRDLLENDENMEILEETQTGYLCYNLECGKEITFTLQDQMTAEWLADKIYINPDISKHYDYTTMNIAKTLFETLSSDHFITLNQIFIVNDENDCPEIAAQLYGDKNAEIQTDLSKFFDDQIGWMGFFDNSVFVNMKNIEEVNESVFTDTPHLILRENKLAFWSTLAHEIRHLMLDTNPYLDETEYPAWMALENEIEFFGNTTAELIERKKML